MTAEQDEAGDDAEFWERNEYEALKTIFADAAYHDAAQTDPETYARYRADRQRLDVLHAKFGPPQR